jgi:hypothetical protein
MSSSPKNNRFRRWNLVGLLSAWFGLHIQTLAFNVPSGSSHQKQAISSSNQCSRRNFLSSAAILSSFTTNISSSSAFPFGDGAKDRRQKELCIVNVLRLQYWAISSADTLEFSDDTEKRKKVYLEARLGAKAMVAKKHKVGGGATPRVFSLISLQIKECLDDLNFYGKNNKRIAQISDDIVESLASIVEFDGLETTQDPSPRSSLTLGQYSDQKALYVRRMLSERITPLTQELVDYFGPDTRVQCEGYVKEYYPSELPPSRRKAEEESSTAIETSTTSNDQVTI